MFIPVNITHLVVKFQGLSQCPALTLSSVHPDISVLDRRVEGVQLWTKVRLGSEGRNDTSLKRHQFRWRQTAL